MRPLITNHGKHSDAKFAYATAADLVENSSRMSQQDALDMRELENDLGKALAKHFRKIADREHAGIEANGHDHFFAEFDANPGHAAEIEAEVMAAYKASPFFARMDKELVDLATRNVHEVVHKYMRDAQNMHRDYFHRKGLVGNHLDLTVSPKFDKNHAHVKMWADIHDGPSHKEYAEALHYHATANK